MEEQALSLADLKAFKGQGDGVASGDERRFFCPIHKSDNQRSLSVSSDGAYFCHSCNAAGVLAEFRHERERGDSVYSLAAIRGWSVRAMQALGARSENGTAQFPMYDHERREVGYKRRKWDNSQFPNGAKSLTNKGGHAGLFVPMDLPTEGPLLIVEGEADCVAALSAGHLATTGTAGSNPGKLGLSALKQICSGRDVVLAPDPDDAGAKWTETVAKAIAAKAASVCIIEPGDDDLDARLRRENDRAASLAAWIGDAQPWEPRARSAAPDTTTSSEIGTTDLDNAERLVKRHGDDFMYCAPWNRFLVWDGRRWRPDNTQQLERWAEETARAIVDEVKGTRDDDLARRLLKWASDSRSDFRIRAMLNRAKPKRPITPEELDPGETCYLLNVRNGVIDLKTGALLRHDRARNITRLSEIDYDTRAACPTWDSVLHRSFDGNEKLIAYFRRAVGYSLIGAILDRVLFILWGVGRNGKTVIRETLAALFGDYGASTPVTTFTERKGESIPNDLARLNGIRFVSASESEQGARLAPALIKSITGGDTLTARFLHQEFFDFTPQFKVWLATNHRPEIPGGGDAALWDRIHLLPFNVQIPPDEAIPLAQLLDTLRAELPGILAWAVRGCLEYQEYGLRPPDEVRAAVADYRSDQDALADFLDARCEVGPTCTATAKELHDAFVEWSTAQGIDKPMSSRSFGRRLGNHGFNSERDRARGRFWGGLQLRNGGV